MESTIRRERDWYDCWKQYAEEIENVLGDLTLQGAWLRKAAENLTVMLAWLGSGESLEAGRLERKANDLAYQMLNPENGEDGVTCEEYQYLCSLINQASKGSKDVKLAAASQKCWSVSYSAHHTSDGAEIESDFVIEALSLPDAYDKARETLEVFTDPEFMDPLYTDYVIWNVGIIDENVWPASGGEAAKASRTHWAS